MRPTFKALHLDGAPVYRIRDQFTLDGLVRMTLMYAMTVTPAVAVYGLFVWFGAGTWSQLRLLLATFLVLVVAAFVLTPRLNRDLPVDVSPGGPVEHTAGSPRETVVGDDAVSNGAG